MIYLCTYFDYAYLPRALAMYSSLEQHCDGFHIFMLCFDELSQRHLKSLSLQHATIIPLHAFELGDAKLTAAKKNRTTLEYYFTCGPSLPLYVFKNYSHVDIITYVDADLFFFSNPVSLIKELDGYSIGITQHNFPAYRKPPKQGKYNVGWLSFKNDHNGISCLQWWRDRCIEWCYERFEDGKYADQLYLDDWPSQFGGVKVLEHKGANVAPWNVGDYEIYEENDQVMVSGYRLVFFHFHGFKQITKFIYNTNLGLTFKPPSKVIKKKIIKPYIDKLTKYSISNTVTPSIRVKRMRARWIQMIRSFVRIVIGVIFRQYIVIIRDEIY